MKKNKILLAVLALVMVLGLGIGSAMAYFTTYVTAKGGMPIRLGDKTELDEKFDGKKHLVVTNNGINPVFVRARAIVPNKYRPKNEESMYENASKNGPWTTMKRTDIAITASSCRELLLMKRMNQRKLKRREAPVN